MTDPQVILQVLKETEVLKYPQQLISTSDSTSLHFYVLAEPAYLEVFGHYGPETKIREGFITLEQPKLLTPGYLLNMEGFSDEAREALKLLAAKDQDLAGILYRMKYRKDFLRTDVFSSGLEETLKQLEERIEREEDIMSVIIKGVDEYWDVSLMKYLQELIVKSIYQAQLPYFENKGYLVRNKQGYSVTRNLEGLPLAARKEIEKMFAMVKRGQLKPARLKQELDNWGVFTAFEDRFYDLFKKG